MDHSLKKRAFAVMGMSSENITMDLKYAYYKRMLQYHPDRNHEKLAHEITALVSEAYALLSGKNIKPVLLNDLDLVALVAEKSSVEIKGMMTYDEWLKSQFYNMEGNSIWSY